MADSVETAGIKKINPPEEVIAEKRAKKSAEQEKQERTDMVKQYLAEITKEKIEEAIKLSDENWWTRRGRIVEIYHPDDCGINKNTLVETPLVELDLYLDQLGSTDSTASILCMIKKILPTEYELYYNYGYVESYGVYNMHFIDIGPEIKPMPMFFCTLQ